MTAYYNEFDPHAAAWLRELIADGLIAPGDVDERSIEDVKPNELVGYTQCHFFAGIGGWSLALRLAGMPDDYPVWTGSCPCQPFSAAGKGLGTDDERHLWPVFARLIAQCRPAAVFGEQVASKAGRAWLAGVRTDLEALGYGVGAADLCAAGVGAPHIRQRLYWVADAGGLAQPHGSRVRDHGRPAAEQGRDNMDPGAASLRQGHGPGLPSDLDTRGAGTFGLADSEAGRRCQVDTHPGRRIAGSAAEGCERPEYSGSAGGLGHPQHPGLEGHTGHEQHGYEPGRQHPDQAGPVAAAGCDSWTDFDWIPCADGKARRIKPGLVPLVDGLPRGMVPSVDPGASGYAEETAEARVMRLRGYGNAIVPQLAATFVRAALA